MFKFFSHSSVFGIYSRRVLITMVARIFEALESLLFFLCHHQLQFVLYPAVVLFSWWFLHAQDDLLITSIQGQNNFSAERLDAGIIQLNDTSKRDQTLPSLEEGVVPQTNPDLSVGTVPKVSPATLRNIQPKTSFLDLRLNDISNRSLNDSIWATPTKTPIEADKTPTQKLYTQKIKDPRPSQIQRGMPLNKDELCSNQAVRAEKPNLEEKVKVFERKNTGISPPLASSLQAPNNGSRVHRNRSYPRLRHSVLTWWAGVEQEQATAEQEPSTELQIPQNFEEDSNCSVCEVIQPSDSWSTVAHNLRSANDRNNPRTRTRRIFANFGPETIVSRKHDIPA